MNLLTVEELAEALRVSRSSLDRWRKIGMPYVQSQKGGKIFFDLEEVKEWLSKKEA